MPPDDNGKGWSGHNGAVKTSSIIYASGIARAYQSGEDATFTLSVYRKNDPEAAHYRTHVPGASDDGKLYIFDNNTRAREMLTVDDVNTVMTTDSDANKGTLRKQFVLLIPSLNPQQKQQLARGLSGDAMEVVSKISPQHFEILEEIRRSPAAEANGAVMHPTGPAR